jgi:Dual-action HEIGH metallo-peptidase
MSTHPLRKQTEHKGFRSDPTIWALALSLGFIGACSVPDSSDEMQLTEEEAQQEADQLFSAKGSGALWDRNVHYCFLKPASQYNSAWQKRKVDFVQIMNRTWNAVGSIQLISDGDCPQSPDRYVATIKYDYQSDGWSNSQVGMRSAVNNTGPDVNISVGFLTGKVSGHDNNVTHEMGHLLGFNHEKDRSNSCNENATVKDNIPGAMYWTSYDPASIMNFSYCNASNGLTSKDKQGLRKAYARFNK